MLYWPRMLVVLEPAVTTTRTPSGTAGWMWLALIALGVLTLIIGSYRRTRKTGGRTIPRTHRGGVGNALQDLSSMLMPNHPDVAVIACVDEEGEHDDRGDGRNPDPPPR